MKLAWNAIVKNERAVIERCVESLLPHIDCAVVVDTGSTDGTQQFLMQKFEMAGKPLEIFQCEFVNFEQARNRALQAARASNLDWDYLILADADMEFHVKQEPWFFPNGGVAYDMRQTGGSLGYYNRRLIARKATGNYVGVTHEYLDVPSDGVINAADFIDHADGANRPDKTARDIALLEDALRTESRPGLIERYTFYLAQSYFDLHEWDKAAALYKKRVALGGFDEERWYAQRQYAHCLGNMDNPSGYLWEMLQAYGMRPGRSEVLYDLARSARERGENDTSLLFSEAGMQIPYPKNDLLFVDEQVYKTGLKEEFSICAYYDPRRRGRGAKECNRLALAGVKQAKHNLYWYLQPLQEHVPSFEPERIFFKNPLGFSLCNPSVINKDGQQVTLVRTVNYTINEEGGYDIRDGDGACSDRNPICTRNFLVDQKSTVELLLPKNLPDPKYLLVRGFEDSRLFEWNGMLRTISTVRELNPDGWCEQVLAPMTEHGYDLLWRKILPERRRNEKNWMPWVQGDSLRFVYRLGTLIDADGNIVFNSAPDFDVDHISGGSQVVQLDERTWIALVHEVGFIPNRPNRFYQHRFVSFRVDGRVDRISAPFVFHDKQIEFAAGLAYFPQKKQLIASYGVRDCEAWTATMDPEEVIRFIYKDAL